MTAKITLARKTEFQKGELVISNMSGAVILITKINPDTETFEGVCLYPSSDIDYGRPALGWIKRTVQRFTGKLEISN